MTDLPTHFPGRRFASAHAGLTLALAVSLVAAVAPPASAAPVVGHFDRVATYDVTGSVAEIVAATPDGLTLVYTDSDEREVGFVDIGNPAAPEADGSVALDGSPTSVAVTPDGAWALVAVDTSPGGLGVSGTLVVVNLATRLISRTIALGGQPDSIAVSRDGRYAAITIENQRDEDINDGLMPQAAAGFLAIVDLVGPPSAWSLRTVTLTGLADRFPTDPEPEFVDINGANVAAVTLQENNHVALVDLPSGTVVGNWSTGSVTQPADLVEDDDIIFADTLTNARREPDAIAWTPGGRLITADEGDYDLDLADGQFVGGRGFTVFEPDGTVAFASGASVELAAVAAGHYPDGRSENKGAEIEGVEVARYGTRTFAFVGSERGDFVAVYRLDDETDPAFVQLLPTGDAPEGLLAIPSRNLFVTANEKDGTISIFAGQPGIEPRAYPAVVSRGLPWGALSGLANAAGQRLYAVPDNAFAPSRIFTLRHGDPMVVSSALMLTRAGSPVAYDLEGIANRPGGGWWVVSEGRRNAGQSGATNNLLINVGADGSVVAEVQLPAAVNAVQRSNGFEGVATNADGSQVYVAFQREWSDDPAGFVKIGRYTPATGSWAFFRYPLDAAPAGGWVGLSEITALDDTTFAVIERDNQAGNAAVVKRIYSFSAAGIEPAAAGATPPVLGKTLVRDILASDGITVEKAEGMALLPGGEIVVVWDNDGAGETALLRFRR